METYKVVGGGLSGLAFGYIATLAENNSIIYEKKDEKTWETSNLRPYVVKPSHLDLIASHVPEIYNIIMKNSIPIYKVRKIVADFKNGKQVEFEYKSNIPIFYVINAIDLFREMIDKGDLKIRFGETTNGKIKAEGGSIWGNILGFGKLIKGETDEVILWYDQNTIPGSYIFEAPIPGSDYSLRALVLFDQNKVFPSIAYVINSLLKPLDIVGKTGYTDPHLTEGDYITIGERGGWIDPLRGFGFYTSILSAKGAFEYLLYRKIPPYLINLQKMLRDSIKGREALVKITNQEMIDMLEASKDYLSVSYNVIRKNT